MVNFVTAELKRLNQTKKVGALWSYSISTWLKTVQDRHYRVG